MAALWKSLCLRISRISEFRLTLIYPTTNRAKHARNRQNRGGPYECAGMCSCGPGCIKGFTQGEQGNISEISTRLWANSRALPFLPCVSSLVHAVPGRTGFTQGKQGNTSEISTRSWANSRALPFQPCVNYLMHAVPGRTRVSSPWKKHAPGRKCPALCKLAHRPTNSPYQQVLSMEFVAVSSQVAKIPCALLTVAWLISELGNLVDVAFEIFFLDFEPSFSSNGHLFFWLFLWIIRRRMTGLGCH